MITTVSDGDIFPEPVDPYEQYRLRYTQVMTDIARVLRRSASFYRKSHP